ncbi:NAD-dependent protein deacetylase sirtuin-1-like [Littorina saxatilis]|uniref:protein acetyllysine N-acetyltransferase n=1 Tax=Littorina saxatilis TaxID=31220 RepID=A0AAN9C2S3_9CAEN
MESEGEKQDYEPLSKRLRLDPDREDAATTSELTDDRYEPGEADSSSSAENMQGGGGDCDSDDSSDDIDNLSGISNLSELNDQCDESSWQPIAGPISWVQRQMTLGVNPRTLLKNVLGDEYEIDDDVDEFKLWNVIINIVMEPRPRKKLPDFNTLDDVVGLLKKCNNILVLTGAGVSVSCGIPDFRSRDGVYARLAKDFPNLPDPQSMFDIDFFKTDQRPFFKFAKEIYPGQFEPSPCHKFIKLLETHGKLLRNYTQNIDTLENVAGIENVIECHGSFATATCRVCGHSCDAEAIRKDIFNQQIPRCPKCSPDIEQAVMKPDIVFFGESLPQKFHKQMALDKNECDLLIVIGSSLKVRPVALIPSAIPPNVPQIIINREPLHKSLNFDVELLGNCDDIISELCKRLGEGWDHLALPGPPAQEVNYFRDVPHPPELPVPPGEKGETTEDPVDHNADSGLGVFGGGSSKGAGHVTHPSSHAGGTEFLGLSNTDRLEWLSSSDSGAESATTPDIHGHIDLAVGAHTQCGDRSKAVSSQESGDSHVSSSGPVSHHCVRCSQASAQGECDCGREKLTCQVPLTADTSSHTQSVKLSTASEETTHHPSSSSSLSHHSRQRSSSESRHSTEPHSTRNGHSPRKRNNSHSHSQGHGEKEKIDIEKESKQDNSHCSHTDTIEQIRQMWVPRRRMSVASRMAENQIVFVPPNRYIFRGAEVYSSSEDSSDVESVGDEDTMPPGSVSPTLQDHDADNSLEDKEIDAEKMGEAAGIIVSSSSAVSRKDKGRTLGDSGGTGQGDSSLKSDSDTTLESKRSFSKI